MRFKFKGKIAPIEIDAGACVEFDVPASAATPGMVASSILNDYEHITTWISDWSLEEIFDDISVEISDGESKVTIGGNEFRSRSLQNKINVKNDLLRSKRALEEQLSIVDTALSEMD